MREMTAQGRSVIDDLARRHDVDAGAVDTLLDAIVRGGGRQAQFSHPALGGMGQWSRDGMIMIGDMFNSRLKANVDALCRDLAEAQDGSDLFEPTPHGASTDWWPDGLGTPSASGAQNQMRYACFPDRRRLVVERDGALIVYDTGDHRIDGVSQRQSGTQDLTFTSQHGPVELHELERVEPTETHSNELRSDRPKAGPRELRSNPAISRKPTAFAPSSLHPSDDVFGAIERLHNLYERGVLTDEEYAEKKKDLLARI